MRTMCNLNRHNTLLNSNKRPDIYKESEEGGCGVVGYASTVPFGGKHIFTPCIQMNNRGNGKGGGIAAVGLCPEDFSISRSELEQDFLIQIALLDPLCRKDIETKYLLPFFHIHQSGPVPAVKDFRDIKGLETKPPDVWRYFCRVKEDVLGQFIASLSWPKDQLVRAEEEFVFRNSFNINEEFYRSGNSMKAFVLSHGRNMMILKVVGYAEHVVQYYQLEDVKAHIWIGHQRYPTKGKVWHPGGAHPFIGMDEALVHNGDFANYASVTEYLKQRGRIPQFSTDTEVSILVFDLLNRMYHYPLEYIIEALAPTTERDFRMLTPEKKEIYQTIHHTHMHGSPDGPWFFIIARTIPENSALQLIGITDTSMLRPQVFALHEGDVSIGLIASEKQAIDAMLESLASEDARICPVADHYWNARGGSHTDGGSFIFTLRRDDHVHTLTCTNKFGEVFSAPETGKPSASIHIKDGIFFDTALMDLQNSNALFKTMVDTIKEGKTNLSSIFDAMAQQALIGNQSLTHAIIEALTLIHDRRYAPGPFRRRKEILHHTQKCLNQIFDAFPFSDDNIDAYIKTDWEHRNILNKPQNGQKLVIKGNNFPAEGPGCLARFLVEAHEKGWRQFICYNLRGHRFIGTGLGPHTEDVTIQVYGSSGDYLGSSMDGAEVFIHGNGQDQIGQILKQGKMVFYGDVGQTFLYGAKGGTVYVMGQVAGRPLINAVGSPRVVINGTSLDYLAESFMAGNPLKGGGFAIVNGLTFDADGKAIELPTPYPGGNLFSLASGGAIFIRDPHGKVDKDQLNGGDFANFGEADWALILPYLEENERLFGITIERDILSTNNEKRKPHEIYRKIVPVEGTSLATDWNFLTEW